MSMDEVVLFGFNIPEEIRRFLPFAQHGSIPLLSRILDLAVEYLESIPSVARTADQQAEIAEIEEELEAEFPQVLGALRYKRAIERANRVKETGVFPVIFTGLHLILKEAIRQRLRPDYFLDQLTKLQLPQPVAELLVKTYRERKDGIVQKLERQRWFDRVIGVRWRVDVTLSNSRMSRIRNPVILMQLKLSSGVMKQFEMTVQQFHEMRVDIATILDDMYQVKSNVYMKIDTVGAAATSSRNE